MRDKVAKALEKVIKNKLVTKTVKKFGANKKAVLISQQIHSIKKENLLNLLKSLKRDEMYPSERNILYRIKEVYHLKPKNWKQFITKLKSNPNSPFDFIEIVDPITKQGSHAIYIKGDFW